MKGIIQKVIYGIAEIIGLSLFGLGFVAYFVSSFDKTTGIWYDGLGRQLYEGPFIARFVFGQERQWPGLGYTGTGS